VNSEASREECFVVLLALTVCASPLLWRLPGWVGASFCLLLSLRAWILWCGAALPSRWLVLLALCVPLAKLFLSQLNLPGRDGGVPFLLLLVGFKLFETHTPRDWRIVLALGFFLTVTPLLYDQSPLAALWLLLSLALLTVALARLAGQSFSASLRHTVLAFGLGLPLTLVLFLIIPRLPGPLWSLPNQGEKARSGLSSVMRPGSISQLILSGDPAFSAVFLGAPPKQAWLYWRVLLLDQFDGQAWRNSERIRYDINNRVEGGQLLDYLVTAAPQLGHLPALDLPVTVPVGANVAAGRILAVAGAPQEERRVQLQSAIGSRLVEPLTPLRRQTYLELPPGNPAARALAQQWRATTQGGRAWASQALNYFRSHKFLYTLTPPVLQGDIIDAFLTNTRQGFCEHYSASFAFLARAAGIPSRVVVGYQGGDYNPVGSFWQVRSSDAHAWVELWLQEEGAWVRFDPTAAAMPGRIDSGVQSALPSTRPSLPWGNGRVPEWVLSIRQAWQAAQFQWQQWVVGYDAEHQRSLFARLGLGERVDVVAVLRAALVGGLLAALPLLLWFWRRRERRDPLEEGWRRLREQLKLAGVAVAASDGPLEVLKRAKPLSNADWESLRSLVGRYVELRYRKREIDPLSAKAWLKAVHGFKPKAKSRA
jgi:transglutaminase-like putative cysteine protease